ncbi:T9SS type A sorting domain-containing protein, partial [candidate division KSB1 bacterium]|nr:T9SS type A sorting domain-containing protein [candidate division KSB1 bacterium]
LSIALAMPLNGLAGMYAVQTGFHTEAFLAFVILGFYAFTGQPVITDKDDFLSQIITDPRGGILATERSLYSIGLVRFHGNFVNRISALSAKPPQNLVLLPNYPNPFNSSTRIRYSMARRGSLEVIVYDINGRKVKTLVDRIQSAGAYGIQWQGLNSAGTQVASGTYLLVLKSAEEVCVQKSVFLR